MPVKFNSNGQAITLSSFEQKNGQFEGGALFYFNNVPEVTIEKVSVNLEDLEFGSVTEIKGTVISIQEKAGSG